MLEVIVLCEGQTEREFCRKVVAPHLAAKGVALSGALVGKPQHKRYGIQKWPIYRADLLRLAKQRSDWHVALLVDYYGMPDAWPGRSAARTLPADRRGAHVEEALRADLEEELPARFHPCVQLHEFESLLFVDPELAALSVAMGAGFANAKDLVQKMTAIKTSCGGNVENINDSPHTAPSKRIKAIAPGYDKVASGVTAAADVSLSALRIGCPWLDRWLSRLEGLSPT